MSRKRLLVVVAMLFVIVTVVIVTRSFGGPKYSGPICEQLLRAAMANDVENSYNMLAASSQAKLSKEEWAKQVKSMYVNYINGKFKLVSSSDATPNGETVKQTRNTYQISSGGSDYEATCYESNQQVIGVTNDPID